MINPSSQTRFSKISSRKEINTGESSRKLVTPQAIQKPPLKSHPQTYRSKSNMAEQVCKYQEDGLHSLADLQDYWPHKKPDTYTLKPYIPHTPLHRRRKSRKPGCKLRKNTQLCTEHNFFHRVRLTRNIITHKPLDGRQQFKLHFSTNKEYN
ncbi:hypothetical protein WN51_00587 [Melipona quadrifasciata]|uniref:Uncharacterized protein n=1 Tax=Melipona quadrifasciata TaxID=166423 RepID=A0A0N0BGG7_9HYME|nr:hypothetical protein WN51_00587 [Melipona quadrifasciata]